MATRFGSDKALALWRGEPLISHVLSALAEHSETVVVCGRPWPGFIALPDRPMGALGPMGGLNAALHYAAAQGYDGVLTAGCDTPVLPKDLLSLLGGGETHVVFEDMPILGYWPSSLAPALEAHLATSSDRSVRRWAKLAGARLVRLGADIANINTPADLDALSQRTDLA